MMASPACHYCDQPAEEECPTCGRLYCRDHGDDVCLRCMAPDSAVPSAMVYRGSILTLVIVTIVTVFLLIRPPADKSQANLVREIPTNTPAVSATATPTPPRTATVSGGDATPGGDGTAQATSVSGTPEPTEPSGPAVHVVVQGDTLSEIASQYETTVEILQSLNPGLTPDLAIGEEIVLP